MAGGAGQGMAPESGDILGNTLRRANVIKHSFVNFRFFRKVLEKVNTKKSCNHVRRYEFPFFIDYYGPITITIKNEAKICLFF